MGDSLSHLDDLLPYASRPYASRPYARGHQTSSCVKVIDQMPLISNG